MSDSTWNITDLIKTIKNLPVKYNDYHADISKKCHFINFCEASKLEVYSLNLLYLLQAGMRKFPHKASDIERLFFDFSSEINLGNPSIAQNGRLYHDLNLVLDEEETMRLNEALPASIVVQHKRAFELSKFTLKTAAIWGHLEEKELIEEEEARKNIEKMRERAMEERIYANYEQFGKKRTNNR